MFVGIDSMLGGNLTDGLSTIILPPFGKPRRESLGPKAAAIVAIFVNKREVSKETCIDSQCVV